MTVTKDNQMECPECLGEGKLCLIMNPIEDVDVSYEFKCPVCNGTKKVPDNGSE